MFESVSVPGGTPAGGAVNATEANVARLATRPGHGRELRTGEARPESKVTMLGLLLAGFVDPNVAAGSSGRATLMGDSDGGHAFFSTNRLQASAHRKSSLETLEKPTHA